MANIQQRRVLFANLDPVVETQKVERRMQQVLDKKKRKKEKKMETQQRDDDVKHFLAFLRQLGRETVCQEIATNDMHQILRILFRDIRNDRDRFTAFWDVAYRSKLPSGTKREQERQMGALHVFMQDWIELELYDGELDRFLQFLRVTAQDGVLTPLVVSLAGDDRERQEQSRNNVISVTNSVDGMFAKDLTDELKHQLRGWIVVLVRRGAYNCGIKATRTDSSCESPDSDSEVEEYSF